MKTSANLPTEDNFIQMVPDTSLLSKWMCVCIYGAFCIR